MYTVFETNHITYLGKGEDGISRHEWVKQLAFYKGDLRNVDTRIDDRFMEVAKKRKEAICIDTISSITFPVKYPLITDNGYILNGYVPVKDSNEKDYNETL